MFTDTFVCIDPCPYGYDRLLILTKYINYRSWWGYYRFSVSKSFPNPTILRILPMIYDNFGCSSSILSSMSALLLIAAAYSWKLITPFVQPGPFAATNFTETLERRTRRLWCRSEWEPQSPRAPHSQGQARCRIMGNGSWFQDVQAHFEVMENRIQWFPVSWLGNYTAWFCGIITDRFWTYLLTKKGPHCQPRLYLFSKTCGWELWLDWLVTRGYHKAVHASQ